ncbi:hypothetical protein C8F01DRAFT_1264304 [Mycena amicta]|nr:hypothetical protein C8F01DRAFT_1264304 [Mycena amicta]
MPAKATTAVSKAPSTRTSTRKATMSIQQFVVTLTPNATTADVISASEASKVDSDVDNFEDAATPYEEEFPPLPASLLPKTPEAKKKGKATKKGLADEEIETNLAIARALIGSPPGPEVPAEVDAAKPSVKGKGKKKALPQSQLPSPHRWTRTTRMDEDDETALDLLRHLNLAKARSLLQTSSPVHPASGASSSRRPGPVDRPTSGVTSKPAKRQRANTAGAAVPTYARSDDGNDQQVPTYAEAAARERELPAHEHRFFTADGLPPRSKATLRPREGFPPIFADTANFYREVPPEQLARWHSVPEPKTLGFFKPGNGGIHSKTPNDLRDGIAGLINVDPRTINVAPPLLTLEGPDSHLWIITGMTPEHHALLRSAVMLITSDIMAYFSAYCPGMGRYLCTYVGLSTDDGEVIQSAVQEAGWDSPQLQQICAYRDNMSDEIDADEAIVATLEPVEVAPIVLETGNGTQIGYRAYMQAHTEDTQAWALTRLIFSTLC